jgi:SAM-dependent methyltransferase
MLLYALTILVSAFLLFQIQPVIAKIILPWFGGSAAVWTVCLLFFQCGLLLGYLYAHALFRYLRPRAQAVVHLCLLVLSAATLPVIPSAAWKPTGGEDPTFRILGLLAVAVGLPYFLLSTTGPLVQAWYARRYEGAVPYRLYALSNAGSMFALLSYPVLFEPALTTHAQAVGWSYGYIAFVLLCGLAAWSARGDWSKKAAPEPETGSENPPYLLWILLPACASTLLLAVTNHLSQDVAAIPFLWVLPLSLYLLSFILCFDSDRWYRRTPFLQLLAVALGGMAYALADPDKAISIKVIIPLFAIGLFICCMVCHGELVRLKPHPRHLTSFYLMISLGGAIGGIFVGLLGPRLFHAYYELPVGMIACAVLALIVWYEWSARWTMGAVAGVALAIYLGMQLREANADYHVIVRNFYGQLKVIDDGKPSDLEAVRKLIHGTINHGEQFLNAARRDLPTTYYGPESGVGLAIREAALHGPDRVAVIGLGTGTLASFGRAGDYYRFYDINPLVIRLARTQFSFLRDSKAKVDVALGDARLSLEREQNGNFDVLAVDAFSSDSIPVHLLTREAFELYFRHLKPGGVLAVHVSNRYLDLQPVVHRLAMDLHKQDAVVDTEDDDANAIFGATWVLVSGRSAFFDAPLIYEATGKVESRPKLRLWTDDYSNLFQILK